MGVFQHLVLVFVIVLIIAVLSWFFKENFLRPCTKCIPPPPIEDIWQGIPLAENGSPQEESDSDLSDAEEVDNVLLKTRV